MPIFTQLPKLLRPAVLALAVLTLAIASSCTHQTEVGQQPTLQSTNADCPATSLLLEKDKREVKVQRVVDGDTIVVSSGEKVRLLGVNTPESVHPKKIVEHFSLEASAFTRKSIEGKVALLVFDQSNSATNHRDQYKRLLAYVYRKEDGFDLNAELIKQGYAHAYTKFPIERLEEFRCYEREARKAAVWSSHREVAC